MNFEKEEKEVRLRRKFLGRHHPKIPYGAIVLVVNTAVRKVQVKYKGETFWVPSWNVRYISKRTRLSKQDLDFIKRASPLKLSEY